ncbi:zinc finger protein 33B-like [Dendroctonus ponderosae]|uniref:zinc finger protein 33B-like n=1 Tax=Dendroctonus ponderosae TaxID=77166 RepID=UPI002035BEAB|nr:zinc finger protein 33B-like [Dendroctonus ponderosae]
MNYTITCNICNKNFGEPYNLRAHIKKFHPGNLNDLAPLRTFKCSAVCNECNKTFVKYSNLTQHVKKYHKDKLNELTKPKKYAFECDKCQKHFTHLRHLKYHKKSHEAQKSSGLKCILCKNKSDASYFTKPDLHEHFKMRHDIDIVVFCCNSCILIV